MKIFIVLSMPRSGSSFFSQLIEADYSVAVRLSPFFSYAYREMSHGIRSNCDLEKWYNTLITSDDEFVTQAKRKSSGEFPRGIASSHSKRALYIKDTRNFQDYVRLFYKFDNINFIFLQRDLSQQLASWINSPEWKQLDISSTNIIDAIDRKSIEDNPDDEYWGIADYFYFNRLCSDFVYKYPSRCIKLHYRDLVDGYFDRIRDIDSDIDMESLRSRFSSLTETNNKIKNTKYSVYRRKGYKGNSLSSADLPEDFIDYLLSDRGN